MTAAAEYVRDTSNDAAEWVALEANHWNYRSVRPVAGLRPSYPDRPHPKSYGADLPMRTTLRVRKGTRGNMTRKWTLAESEKTGPNYRFTPATPARSAA